tara:strand:+ start:96 stop:338 length:243 start_codon:yes stop_codon:yes gene_type:complete
MAAVAVPRLTPRISELGPTGDRADPVCRGHLADYSGAVPPDLGLALEALPLSGRDSFQNVDVPRLQDSCLSDVVSDESVG